MAAQRLSVLLTQYDREKYRPALAALIRAIAGLDTVEPTFVVVDNKEEGDWTHEVSASLVHIGGDNRAGEFSAFDKGMTYLQGASRPSDIFVVATDALLAYGDDFLDLIDDGIIEVVTNLEACVGWMDGFGQSCQIGEFTYNAWMRTSLVFFPRRVLASLSPLAVDLEKIAVFTNSATAPFSPDAHISRNLQQLLCEWLTTNDADANQLPETWHSRFRLTEETLSFFQRKVSAILREHLLSARLQSTGVPCYDLRAIRRLSDRGCIDAFLEMGGDESWQWMGWRGATLPAGRTDRVSTHPEPRREQRSADRVPVRPIEVQSAISPRPPQPQADAGETGVRTFILPAHLCPKDTRSRAAEFFAERVIPLVRQRHASVRGLILIDTEPDSVKEIMTSGTGVLRVDDASSATFDECVGIIVPPTARAIEPSSISELLRWNLPMVADRSAFRRCELVPGEDYVVADSATDFASACCGLLEGSGS